MRPWVHIETHETQSQSKELTQIAGVKETKGHEPEETTDSEQDPVVINATIGTAGKTWLGSEDWMVVSLFWWLYHGYIENASVCRQYTEKYWEVTGHQMATYSQLRKREFFVLYLKHVSLRLFQNKKITQKFVKHSNTHHKKMYKIGQKIKITYYSITKVTAINSICSLPVFFYA